MCKHIFYILSILFIEGNSVVHVWNPIAMTGPVTRIKYFLRTIAEGVDLKNLVE